MQALNLLQWNCREDRRGSLLRRGTNDAKSLAGEAQSLLYAVFHLDCRSTLVPESATFMVDSEALAGGTVDVVSVQLTREWRCLMSGLVASLSLLCGDEMGSRFISVAQSLTCKDRSNLTGRPDADVETT